MIQIHFERSESLGEFSKLPSTRASLDFDDSDGSWVQLTYGTLRTQDGRTIAELVDDTWYWNDEPWSDIVIELKAQEVRTTPGTTATMTNQGDGTWTCSAGCPFVFMVDGSSDDVAYHLEWHAQQEGRTDEWAGFGFSPEQRAGWIAALGRDPGANVAADLRSLFVTRTNEELADLVGER